MPNVGWCVDALDKLKHEEHATKQHAVESRIQHAELTLSCPWVGTGTTSTPYREQVAHLKNGKYHKLEKRDCRVGIEQVLKHDT